MDQNDHGRLESLNDSLYKKEVTEKEHRHGIENKGRTVNRDWGDVSLGDTTAMSQSSNRRTSFFKKFFITTVVFFIIALVFALIKVFSSGEDISSNNVDVQIIGNSFVSGGEELKLTVQVTNRNPVSLEVADLIVSYAKNNETIAEDPTDVTRTRIPLGTIPNGKTVTQAVPLTLYGPEGGQKQIEFRLEYKIPDSTALFDKAKDFVVTLSSSPLSLTTDGSPVAVSGQPYQFTIIVSANTKESIKNLFIKTDYPTGFTFTKATPAPSTLENGWLLPEVIPGTPQKITIMGILRAQNGEERSFRIYSGTQSDRDKSLIGITYASTVHLVSIVRPFIETELIVNGEKGDTVALPPENQVSVDIPWKNNLPFKVSNVKISVTIEGDVLDKNSINITDGYYDSSQNKIVWDQNTMPALRQLLPNQTGHVGFTFVLPKLDPTIKNPKIVLHTATEAVESGLSGGEPLIIDNLNTTTIKIISDFQAKTETLHDTGPIPNTGSIPPKVDTDTLYTIHWMIYNGANSLSNVVARAVLPPGVTFTNVISPSVQKNELTYNDKNREVVWSVKNIPGGTGITNAPKEIYFQVTLKPSLSLVGTVPTLTKEGSIGGFDTFAGINVQRPLPETTTDLTGDGNYSPEAKTVVQ
jgi:hypothetical protein